MALQPLTPEERRAALEKAFASRQARARVKSDLKSGETTIAAVIAAAAEDPALQKMKVYDLLRSLPKVGDRRAEAVMAEFGIAPTRRLKGLGVHQTAALLERFATP